MRTPEEIIGRDLLVQLEFEGYEVRKVEAKNHDGMFAGFWLHYPNKVGKREAEKAFDRALKRAAFTDIMFGLSAYVKKKDDRPWCNPSTWLNQDRWEDRPAQVVGKTSALDRLEQDLAERIEHEQRVQRQGSVDFETVPLLPWR